MAEGAEGSAGGGGGVLRELFVLLGLDVDEASFAKGMLAANLLTEGLKTLAEKAVETVKEFVGMIKETAEAGERIEVLAQQTGISTEELQNLLTAAQATGLGVETMTHAILTLSRNLYAAGKGGGEAGKQFTALGIKLKDPNGKLKSSSEVLEEVANKFQKLPDGTNKSALAMRLFGRQGAQLIPLLNKGKDGIEALAAQYPNLTEAQIKASSDLVKEQKKIGFDTQSFWQQVIAPQIELLVPLIKRYRETRKAMLDFIQPKLTAFVTLLVKGFAMLYRGMSAVSRVIVATVKLIAKNWQLLAYMLAGVTIAILAGNAAVVASFVATAAAATWAAVQVVAAWLLAAAPFVAIAAAIYTLFLYFDDLRVYLNGGRSLIGKFMTDLKEWWKPQPGDTFFIAALKTFLRFCDKAIVAIKKLSYELGIIDEETFDKLNADNKSDIQDKGDKGTIETARKRLTQNKKAKLTPMEKAALGRQNMDEGDFVADVKAHPYVEQATAPPSAGGMGSSANVSSVQQTNNVTINGTGLDEDQLMMAIQRSLQPMIDDTAAASGQ